MKKILIVLLVIFVAGCAKKYTRSVEETEAQGAQGSWEVVREEPVDTEIAYAQEEGVAEKELSLAGMASTVLKDVLFDYDKYNIRPDARPALDAAASFMNEYRDVNVVIEGHCDERGTNEYNLALGERRARSTKTYLVSLGIASSRISIMTYGEEKPVCTSSDESCWQRNRRAHFVVVGQQK